MREKIASKARKEFYKYGVKSITMDEIASKLGISKRTIYEKFKDKEELLIECILLENREKKEQARLIKENSQTVLDLFLRMQKLNMRGILKISNKYYADIRKYYPQAQELLKEIEEERTRGMFQLFKEGVEQGVFRDDINFNVVGVLLRSQLYQLFSTVSIVTNEEYLREIYESLIYIYIRGVSTPQGQEVLDKYIEKEKNSKREII